MKCSECGIDLKESGVLCETSLTSYWDEEKGTFLLDIDQLTINDFEIKCPECYSLGIDAIVERK